jgi:ankyrin repeat protein
LAAEGFLDIAKGADINAKTDDGWTALHSASSPKVSPKIAELLIEKGAAH